MLKDLKSHYVKFYQILKVASVYHEDVETLRAKFTNKYRFLNFDILEYILEGAALGLNPVRGFDFFISYAKGESLLEH